MNEFRTHSVENQPPPLAPYNAYCSDQPLREAVMRFGADWAESRLVAYGALAGGELRDLGELANRHPPVLRTHDRFGHRLDEVEFHPAYHQLMAHAMSHGLHALPWQLPQPGSHVARAALEYLHHQADAGTNCPLTMTYASVPALRQAPVQTRDWLRAVEGERYDPRSIPVDAKGAATLGMGMTEKQGGSDVRANTTRAIPQADGSYALTGHKWFLSAPMSDGFLVLAQAPAGLTCFLLPRMLDNGERNALHFQRLKSKLGNHSNASSEVEFDGALAWRIGDEGRGVATILQMVSLTRLDCMVGSAAQMRQALVQAMHHAQHRNAFGKLLIQQPLMRNVLADLALECEAALLLAMRTAQAIDRTASDPHEAALARILTPIGKYWICGRAPRVVIEAAECLGGAGYVEESIMPRLVRESPLNSIWEGCGNVQCLDVLRALSREPASVDALCKELESGRGFHPALDAHVTQVTTRIQTGTFGESDARALTADLALALQGVLLSGSDSTVPGELFCASRLAGKGAGSLFGTLPSSFCLTALLDRAALVS